MATLKEMAATAKLVTQDALEKTLTDLKGYIDTQDSDKTGPIAQQVQQLKQQLDTLTGTSEGDLDNIINTFNEVKAFLADYTENDTLKSLIDAAVSAATTAASTAETNAKAYTDTKVGTEETRAKAAEKGLADRITTLENVSIMSAQEAETIFNDVFNND